MTALAAANLGYRCHVFCHSADEPAAQIATRTTLAAFNDNDAVDAFAANIDVATLEFENIPIATLERIARHTPVRPSPAVQAVAQNRLREKSFANELGIATAPFRAVTGADAGVVGRSRRVTDFSVSLRWILIHLAHHSLAQVAQCRIDPLHSIGENCLEGLLLQTLCHLLALRPVLIQRDVGGWPHASRFAFARRDSDRRVKGMPRRVEPPHALGAAAPRVADFRGDPYR